MGCQIEFQQGSRKLIITLIAIVVQCGYIMVNGLLGIGYTEYYGPNKILTGFLFFPALALMRVVGVCSDRRPQQ